MNREIELKTIRLFFDDDVRLVYYRLKSPLFFERLFAKKGILSMAYRFATGRTILFDAQEYQAVKKRLKTYEDVENWKKEQRDYYLKAKYNNEKNWNE